MAIYHYTTGTRLHDIAKSGVLRTFPERPVFPACGVVWLTTNAVMECSVLDEDRGAPQAFAAKHHGLYRFVVHKKLPMQLFRWHRLTAAMRLHWSSKKNLAAWAIRVGANTDEWLGVLQSLPLEYLGLERFEVDGSWRPVSLEDALAMTPPPMPRLVEQGGRYRHRHMGAGFR